MSDIRGWAIANKPDDALHYSGDFWAQIDFVEYQLRNKMMEWDLEIAGSHTSKSVKLPVYHLASPNGEIKIWMRNNFYDWKLSIDSRFPIEIEENDFFDKKEIISDLHCEGFALGWVFGSYARSNRRFTCEISSNYELYALFREIGKQLGAAQKSMAKFTDQLRALDTEVDEIFDVYSIDYYNPYCPEDDSQREVKLHKEGKGCASQALSKVILLRPTGARDINGKQVWEGDAMKFGSAKGVVVYDKKQAAFVVCVKENGKIKKELLKNALEEPNAFEVSENISADAKVRELWDEIQWEALHD